MSVISTEAGRRAIYSAALAVLALLAGYGLIEGDKLDLWGELIGALVAILALFHIGARGVDSEVSE